MGLWEVNCSRLVRGSQGKKWSNERREGTNRNCNARGRLRNLHDKSGRKSRVI